MAKINIKSNKNVVSHHSVMLGGKRVSKEIVTQVLFTEARCMKYTGHVI